MNNNGWSLKHVSAYLTSRFGALLLSGCFAALLCAPILFHMTSVLAGDSTSPDWSGTWHALWTLRDHGFRLWELTSIDLFNYPSGFGFVGATGNFVDLFLLAGLQSVFGPVAGYNLGVFCILVFMSYAVNRCVFHETHSPALSALAAMVFLFSRPVFNEIENGVYSHLVAIGTAALALTEFGRLQRNERGAALGLGIWGALTAVVQWYFGLMLCLVLVLPGVWAFVRPALKRKRLRRLVTKSFLVSLVVVAIPLWFQIQHVNDVSGVENGFVRDMFPGTDARFEMILLASGSKCITPYDLLVRGWVPGIIAVLAVLSLRRRQTRETALWWTILALAVVLSWGAHAGGSSAPGAQMEPGIHLPYWYLAQCIPYLWRMMWVDRLSLFILLAATVLAMRSLDPWLHGRRAWLQRVALLACGLLVLVESAAREILPIPHRPVYAARSDRHRAAAEGMEGLCRAPSRPAVVAYPGRGVMAQHHCYFQTLHQRAMLNSPKGLRRDTLPPELLDNRLVEALTLEPHDSPKSIRAGDAASLAALGFGLVLVHTDLVDTSPERFRQLPLGECLEKELGRPEEHGCLLIYRLPQK